MIAEKILSNAQKHPDKNAVLSKGNLYTYKDIELKVNDSISEIESVKLSNNEPFAIIMPNCIEFLALLFAAEKTGHCAVLLSEKFKSSEINYHIECSEVKYIFTLNKDENEYKKYGFSIVKKSVDIIIWKKDKVVNQGAKYYPKDYICQISSGTNGVSKGVIRTIASVRLEIEETIQCADIKQNDVFLTIPPIYHSYGLVAGALLPLFMGSFVILPETFIVADIMKYISAYGVTILFAVPFMYQMMCESKATVYEALSTLRKCFSAGAPMPEELFHRFYEVSNIYITQDYGSTETGVMCINNKPDLYAKSVGKPVGGRIFRVLNEEYEDVGLGQEGNLFTKSACNAGRYLYPEEFNSQFSDGWLKLDDYGYIDDNGYIYVIRRITNIINVAGMKVDPYEVEQIIMEIPGVKDAVVAAKHAKPYGTVVKAFVVAADNVGVRDIIEHCRNRIADYKIPKAVEFLDQIPKSPVGKILRKYLV